MNKEQKVKQILSEKSWILLYDYHPLYHKRKKMVYYAKHPDHYEVMFLGETLDEVERFVNILKSISEIYK